MGGFLLFGAVMAFVAGTTLLWPGTVLDRMWLLNSRAYNELEPFGKAVGVPFLFLAATLAIAGMSWFKRNVWGWRLAVAIIGIQFLGDLVHVFTGHIVEGGIGTVIAGVLLFWLLQTPVRAGFENYGPKR